MPACCHCHRFDQKRQLCTVECESPLRKCVIALLEKEALQIRGNVLEIGPGQWDFAKRLLETSGCKWYGIDPLLVDKKGRSTIATHKGTVDHLPFRDNWFDYVLGNQTLEHWVEYGTTYARGLAEIHRVLKPGGILSLNVPIYLHGDSIFVSGDIKAIISLFNPHLWANVSFDPWRREYEPLSPYKGWRLNGLPDNITKNSDQPCPSSWIMQIQSHRK